MAFAAAMLRKMLWGLEAAHLSRRQLLEGIVDESHLGDDFWLTDADFYEIVARALRLSRNPALGLLVGQREGNCLALGALGLHVSVANSFEQALSAIVRLQSTLCDRPDLSLARSDTSLTLEFGPINPPLAVRWFLTEAMLCSMQVLFQQFAGLAAEPITVSLDYPAPPHAASYRDAFHCEVRFEQPRSALMVPRSLAAQTQLFSQPLLAATLGKLAEDRLDQSSCCLASQVRSLFRQQWKLGLPTMSDLARQLGLSERTLRRRLMAEGVNFRAILTERRCELAREMLQTGMGVKQVAYELGYRSNSAFHRAFRRWEGASPAAFAARDRCVPARDPGGSGATSARTAGECIRCEKGGSARAGALWRSDELTFFGGFSARA